MSEEQAESSESLQDKLMPLGEHLNDLRKLLIISLVSVAIAGSVAYLVYGDQIMAFLTAPLRNLGLKLIFTSPFEAVFTQLKAGLFVGFIVVLPIILWQIWRFVLPALQSSEARMLVLFVPLSLVLFVGGMAFAYFTVFQIAVEVLLVSLPGPGLEAMIKIDEYFSFLFSFLLPFGITFEMPLIVYVLTKLGVITHQTLKAKRKFALLTIVVLAAILTPGPDPLSQTLLALPMFILYEISIIVAKFSKPKPKAQL